jgi:hypothetical protein
LDSTTEINHRVFRDDELVDYLDKHSRDPIILRLCQIAIDGATFRETMHNTLSRIGDYDEDDLTVDGVDVGDLYRYMKDDLASVIIEKHAALNKVHSLENQSIAEFLTSVDRSLKDAKKQVDTYRKDAERERDAKLQYKEKLDSWTILTAM